MKIRVTILTENNIPRESAHTEALVKAAWQMMLNVLADDNENATVEKVEFVEGDEC